MIKLHATYGYIDLSTDYQKKSKIALLGDLQVHVIETSCYNIVQYGVSSVAGNCSFMR